MSHFAVGTVCRGQFAAGQIAVGTPKYIQGLDIFLGLVDPSRNRLASTVYFAIVSSTILGGLLSGDFCPGFFDLPCHFYLVAIEQQQQQINPNLFSVYKHNLLLDTFC